MKKISDLLEDDFESDMEELPNNNIKIVTLPCYLVSLLCTYYLFLSSGGQQNVIRCYFLRTLGEEDGVIVMVMLSFLVMLGIVVFLGDFIIVSRICSVIQVIVALIMVLYILTHVYSFSGYIERGRGTILFLISSSLVAVGTFRAKPVK